MSNAPTPRKLRWFQVSLRDILALTVICAVSLGWWLDRRRLAEMDRTAKEAAAEIRSLQDRLVTDSLQRSKLRQQFESAFRDFPSFASPRQLPINGRAGPTIYGQVTAVHPTEGFVEINLGTDDGLRKGDTLDVCRSAFQRSDAACVARIRLCMVEKTKALGISIQEFSKGAVQVDYHVAARRE